jgi:transposase InsO family protein
MKTTTDSLGAIFNGYIPPDTFMTDGGTHFTGKEVGEFCERWGVKHHVISAYSPWVNGLVEGTNKILLHVLKQLCSPELGEDTEEFKRMSWVNLPDEWPEHLDEAMRILNNCILPAFRFTPNKLMMGVIVNTRKTPLEDFSPA